ncbi:PEP-CTERM sorting domain-containing protein [Roseateles albus]|uniref:PEP-CTERM sorting domain-containing protein n=1 Tax=Roseateles albus TaxID=2987525 RepID=UPI00235A0B99|nr:PEP-CTERM sorting domain-containing protein [Roseateles albus]
MAALAAASFTPAFATIATGWGAATGDAELVFIAYNDKGSFTKDLGITTNQFLVQGLNVSVLGSEYSRFQALGGTGTVWSLQATNQNDFGANPFEINTWITKNSSQVAGNLTNALFNNASQNLAGFFAQSDLSANNAGIGLDAGVNNIEWTGLVGTEDYANGYTNLGNTYGASSAVGEAADIVYLTSSGPFASSKVLVVPFTTVQVNFDGSTITAAATLAPIPEPSTYAMLMAGLVGLGFVARRRQA